MSNPLVGGPVQGDRLVFGENSWLALLEATGIIGAILAVWLMITYLLQMRDLWEVSKSKKMAYPADFCLAGLAALFVGSFLEPYLLGVITLPVLALVIYSFASERVLSVARNPALSPSLKTRVSKRRGSSRKARLRRRLIRGEPEEQQA
jgi:hypothetical protein